jgi:hypothetical protein
MGRDMADRYDTTDDGTKRRRPVRNALIIAGLAFLIGLAAMGWALTRWDPARRLIAPTPEAAKMAAGKGDLPLLPKAQGTLPTTTPLVPPLPSAVLDQHVADLESRIARIDQRAQSASGNATRAESLLIAFAARRAIDRGMALGYLEGQLSDRFAATQPRAVAAVIAAARMPVTVEQLRLDLDKIAPELAGGRANEGWWDGLKRSMSGLIIVRRSDRTSPAAADRVARAQRQLDGGQVDAALAEIARLPSQDRAADWITGARRYIEAHRALDLLEAAVIMVPETTVVPVVPSPAPTETPKADGSSSSL